MTYTELKAHAEQIKELAISKTVDQGIQATPGGAIPQVGLIEDYARERFANTHTIFDDWIDLPDPGTLNNGLLMVEAACRKLGAGSYLTDENAQTYAGGDGTSTSISQIEPTGAFMQGWQSGTAISYANFAGVFGPVAANLSLAMNVLRGSLDAERALWEEARKNVDDLAHATITALEKCTDKSPEDVAMTLTVLGAVAGIVAVPFTAGGSLAASYTFAAIGAATSLGGAFVPVGEDKPSPITGDVPWEIVDSLQTNLNTLNTDIGTAEDEIDKALSQSADDFSTALDLEQNSPVKMPRPSVADDPSFGRHS